MTGAPPPLNFTGGAAQSAADAFADIANGGVTTGDFNAAGSGSGLNSGAASITNSLVVGAVLIVGLMLWLGK